MAIVKLGVIALVAAVVSARTVHKLAKPPIDPTLLENTITSEALLRHAQALEDIAYASPERNRQMGSKGHDDTVTYIWDQLAALNGYYNVRLQQFSALVQESGDANFTVDGVDQEVTVMDYSPSATVTALLVPVSNLGCNITDFPAEVDGNIALISRGTCPFAEKSINAGLAGAIGAVIYNNIPNAGGLNGTLGLPRADPFVPSAGFSLENGTALVNRIRNGETIIGELNVVTVVTNRTTNNVIAQTVGGDQENVLTVGAHTDSVAAGPGINDDGSGTVGILESAIQLSNYETKNAVRFGFWSGEEEGLLGSTFYVEGLPASELAKIRLYLNFDMIASPNYMHAIFDGDGSTFNTSGAQGSAEAERNLQDFFTSHGQNYTAGELTGRSDYGPFLAADIAVGGTDTGAEGIKTPELAAKFGGEVGVPFDINYHQAGDNVTNLNVDALLLHSKAIAYSIGLYGDSFASLGQNVTSIGGARRRKRESKPSSKALKRNPPRGGKVFV